MLETPRADLPFELAVICVTHDSASLIGAFARGLRDGLGALRAIVVFVDSGSTDTTLDAISTTIPDAYVVALDGNRGFAAGINAGVRRVDELGGAQAYAVVNPDVVLGCDCLPLLAAAVRDPTVGIAAPRLHNENGAVLPSLRTEPRVLATWCEAVVGGPAAARMHLPTEVFRVDARYQSDGAAAWATGGMLVISRECSRAVGEWDESFFLYEEEVDFALRAADRGFALRFIAGASAIRTIGPGPVAPWAQALMRANRVALVSRRSGRAAAVATRLAFLVGESARALIGRPASRAAVWGLVRPRTPAQIMSRYYPAARAVTRSARSSRGGDVVDAADMAGDV